MRVYVALTTIVALSMASCYAHVSWLTVDAGDPAAIGSSDRVVAFSEQEKRAAVRVAASVAERLGLSPSWMREVGPPPKMTAEDPFQELALYQGTGANSNLMLSVDVKDDGSVLRLWITLDHSEQTELVSELVRALKDELSRAFPDRKITVGGGRKLNLYGG